MYDEWAVEIQRNQGPKNKGVIQKAVQEVVLAHDGGEIICPNQEQLAFSFIHPSSNSKQLGLELNLGLKIH